MEIVGGVLMILGGSLLVRASGASDARDAHPLEAELTAAWPGQTDVPRDFQQLLSQLD